MIFRYLCELENELEVIVGVDHTAHEVGQKNLYHPANKDGEKYADESHYDYGKPKQGKETAK